MKMAKFVLGFILINLFCIFSLVFTGKSDIINPVK